MGFYGNITSTNKTQFTFDRIYPNRTKMDVLASTDGIFIGRFVFLSIICTINEPCGSGLVTNGTITLGGIATSTSYINLYNSTTKSLVNENTKYTYSKGITNTNIILGIYEYINGSWVAKQYNTKAIINAMRKHNIFAITHPGDKGEVDIVEIAKVAKETDTRLEINGGHGFLSVKQIEAIKSIKNKYIIGSDAHVPENVGNFDLAMKIIEEANLDVSLVENIKI